MEAVPLGGVDDWVPSVGTVPPVSVCVLDEVNPLGTGSSVEGIDIDDSVDIVDSVEGLDSVDIDEDEEESSDDPPPCGGVPVAHTGKKR